MELEELRMILVERYIAGGYERARAEAVIDAAIAAHKASIEFRAEQGRRHFLTLAPGMERTHYLGTLLSLELQHNQMLMAAFAESPPETVQ